MFVELYYFPSILEKKFKISTTIESLKKDLNNFSIYYYWQKIKDNEKINLFVKSKNIEDIFVPSLIFQIQDNLSKIQLNELLDIFLSHGEEKFIINYSWFKLKPGLFLQLSNIGVFLKKANSVFEDFLKIYTKTGVLDETSQVYKEFRKIYSLFLYLNYLLVKTYKDTNLELSKIKNLQTWFIEYTSHIKLLETRLNLDKDSLEKNIVVFSGFLEKFLGILKSFDKKVYN